MRSGFSVPLRFTSEGRLARASGRDKLGEALASVLRTRLGERFMRPSYGLYQEALFREVPASMVLLRETVRAAIAEAEPSVVFKDLRLQKVDGAVTVGISVTDSSGDYVVSFAL